MCKIGLREFAYHLEKDELLKIAAYEGLDVDQGTKAELLDKLAADPKARQLCIKHLLSQRAVDTLVEEDLIMLYKINTTQHV